VILEWDVPFELITPQGTLPLNALASSGTTQLGFYLLDPSRCQAGAARRVTRHNIAQADGEITHRKFKSGHVIELVIQLWQHAQKYESGREGQPACDGILRAMGDLLALHLNSIENADGRLQWTPSAIPGQSQPVDRMFDKVRSLGPSGQGQQGFVSVIAEKDSGSPLTTVTFALLSPFPYAMDAPQTTTNIATGATVTNGGDSNFWPVLRVYGPTNGFTITNTSALDDTGNPLKLVYDSTLPGAQSILSGHYAEIDTFRSTVYLDGSGANLKAGIDVANTDFWPLVPGANVLTVSGYTGSTINMLWQNAYS
jgi:hypothetical protein